MKEKLLHLGCFVKFFYLNSWQIGKVQQINEKTVLVLFKIAGKERTLKINIESVFIK